MPEQVTLEKARLVEVRLATRERPAEIVEATEPVVVHFNPETLRVSRANSVKGEDEAGGSTVQFVSRSTTKMTVELWFDATGRAAPEVDDVRQVTDLIAYFMRPVERRDGGLAPPPVRFQWGTFSFDGVMETMEETLELFAADGRPLRARVSISIAARPIVEKKDPRRDRGPGTRPRAPIRQNESLQQAMGRTGSPEGWQEEAERNGIENPRRPPVGSSVGLSDQGRS